jgi:undecaprenyl-diphosphatase
MNANLFLFNFLNGFANRSLALDRLIIFSAERLPILLFVAWVLWFLWLYRDRPGYYLEHMAAVLLPTVVAWALSGVLKIFLATPRPFAVLIGLHPLFLYVGSAALPSGHATFFAAFGTAIWFEHRRAGIIFLAGAVLIALARVAAGIHWPIDVAVGLLLGGLVSSIASKLLRLPG